MALETENSPILKKHAIRNVVRAFSDAAWAITEEKLAQICELIELRAAGEEYTIEEIQDRIGVDAAARNRSSDDGMGPGYQVVDGVAVLPLQGVMAPRMNLMMQISGGTSTSQFGAIFQQALSDPDVKAIVIDTDSPGGAVVGTAELAMQIFAARGQKPIAAIANHQMASAALWVGTAADEVIVSPSSLIGSIGVVGVHTDVSARDKAEGLKRTVIRVGKHKADGNPYEPLSEQARATIQDRMEEIYAAFVGAVARHRGVSTSKVEKDFGQGKELLADRAVAAGLADRVATLEQVVSEYASRSSKTAADGRQSVSFRAAGAAAGAGEIQPAVSAGTPAQPTLTEVKVNPQLKAALFARGLIASMEASDEVCNAALRAFFAARSQAMPEKAEDQTTAVMASASPPAQQAQQQNTAAQSNGQATGAPAQQTQPDTAQILAAERKRVADIRSRGQILQIAAAEIDAAIDSGLSAEAASEKFFAEKAKTHNPVTGAGVSVEGAPIERIVAGAAEALAYSALNQQAAKLKADSDAKPKPLSAEALPFRGFSMLQVAIASLRSVGMRPDEGNPIQTARQFLSWSSGGIQFGATSLSYNTQGMYPNLFSVLANKFFEFAIETARTTFRSWTFRRSDMDNLLPHTLIRLSASGELPEIGEQEEKKQYTRAEEAGFYQGVRYGAKFAITPLMVINNQLDAFSDLAVDQQRSHELTINRACINLLTGNPLLPDGTAFFNTSRNNDVAGGSGGAPSQAQMEKHETAMLTMKDHGGKVNQRIGPAGALVPAALKVKTEQFLSDRLVVVPTADSGTNTYRGNITAVHDPMLDDASALVWYMFADPRLVKGIIHAYLKGHENGSRNSWFDPDSGNQYFGIEAAFAAAVNEFRGWQRNPGA